MDYKKLYEQRTQDYYGVLGELKAVRFELDQVDDGEMPIAYYVKLAHIATRIDKFLTNHREHIRQSQIPTGEVPEPKKLG